MASHPILKQIELTDATLPFRVLGFTLLGTVIAGALTFFMHILIESSQHELDTSLKSNLLDFVRVKRDETSQPKRVKPKRPEMNDAPPAPPTPQADQADLANTQINVGLPQVSSDMNIDVGGIGLGTRDGEYLPIVKIAPNYPIEALSRGIEGECTVEYTVSTTGATKNIRIVEGMCPRVFMRASILAAKKFKYKPKIEDGKNIEVEGVRNKFIFELSQAGK